MSGEDDVVKGVLAIIGIIVILLAYGYVLDIMYPENGGDDDES